MFVVMGRQTVVQLVKTKSATQYFPFKSSKPNVSLSCVVNSKSDTSSDMFVSIWLPPHAAKVNIRILEKANNFISVLILIVSFLSDHVHLNYILASEEHTSELQSRFDLVCRLLLEKKKFFFLIINILL